MSLCHYIMWKGEDMAKSSMDDSDDMYKLDPETDEYPIPNAPSVDNDNQRFLRQLSKAIARLQKNNAVMKSEINDHKSEIDAMQSSRTQIQDDLHSVKNAIQGDEMGNKGIAKRLEDLTETVNKMQLKLAAGGVVVIVVAMFGQKLLDKAF